MVQLARGRYPLKGMALDRISLSRFRNHEATALDGTRQFNLLVGENGAGKTNILEALSLLSPGRGLRSARLAEMAGNGGPGGFAIGASLIAGDAEDLIRIGTYTEPDRPNRRLVKVNGASTSAASLGEWLAIGWLTPAMERLFSDSAGARRRFLDRMVLALEPGHASVAARYEHALRERNRLLAEETLPEAEWLEALEAQMARQGAALMQQRASIISAVGAELALLPDEPFARPALAYDTQAPFGEEALRTALRAGRPRDRAAARSLTGPHRDDLLVTIAGRDVPAAMGSTGEQKALLIAMSLAHAVLAARGRPGLLLLDEVAAHLDPLRRRTLFDRLRTSGAQIWLTGTEIAPFEHIRAEAAIWRVESGRVERIS